MLDELAIWVQMITQTLTMVIAGLTAYVAWKTYFKDPVQDDSVEDSVDKKTNAGKIHKMTVFDTNRQKTTLKVSGVGLECYLENKAQGVIRHQWTLGPDEVLNILDNHKYHVNPGYKANTGLFSVGPRFNWLYSKKLFPEAIYLEDQLKEILKNASNVHERTN